MGRRKAHQPFPATPPTPIEPEEESQEIPEEEEAEPEEPAQDFRLEQPANDNRPQGNVSKANMVREAVAAGMEKPADGVAWIKARYGIDLPKPMWSSYRAGFKRRESGGQAAPKREARAAASAPAPQPAVDGSMIQDMKALKHLIERLGADQVREMIELFE